MQHYVAHEHEDVYVSSAETLIVQILQILRFSPQGLFCCSVSEVRAIPSHFSLVAAEVVKLRDVSEKQLPQDASLGRDEGWGLQLHAQGRRSLFLPHVANARVHFNKALSKRLEVGHTVNVVSFLALSTHYQTCFGSEGSCFKICRVTPRCPICSRCNWYEEHKSKHLSLNCGLWVRRVFPVVRLRVC